MHPSALSRSQVPTSFCYLLSTKPVTQEKGGSPTSDFIAGLFYVLSILISAVAINYTFDL